MADYPINTHIHALKAARTGTRGRLPMSPAHLAYTAMSAALSAAIGAETALTAASTDIEHQRLVDVSDAAVSEAMTAARIAAGASIKRPADHALVFSAQLISFGLRIEHGTERHAFLQCLAESDQFWAAYDGLGQAKFAIRDAIGVVA